MKPCATQSALCHIPISRFYRDRAVFQHLGQNVLSGLAQAAQAQGSGRIRIWSAGCGAGEEPYTLAVLWRLTLQSRFPDLELQILATDIDRRQLERAHGACYARGSQKELPAAWIPAAFEESGGCCHLRSEFRTGIEFRQQDIRMQAPQGPFDLALCRNLAFTYFEEELQRKIAASLHECLASGGVLVLGIHEVLPPGVTGFHPHAPGLHIYRKEPASGAAG